MAMKSTQTFSLRCLLAALMLASAPALAEPWEVIVKDRDRQVEIDRSSVIQSDSGSKVAWGRIVLSPERAAEEGYAAVKALNRFDCYNRSFYTVKRVYLDARQLVLREENVIDQRPILAVRNTVDDRLWREVCRPASANDLRHVAREAAMIAEAARGDGAAGTDAADAASPTAAAPTEMVRSAASAAPSKAAAAPAHSPDTHSPDTHSPDTRQDDASQQARDRAPVVDRVPETVSQRVQDILADRDPGGTAGTTTAASNTEVPGPKSRQVPRAARGAPSAPRTPMTKAAATRVATEPEWSYDGDTGPAHWSTLRPDWALCTAGKRQSPIDLRDGVAVDLEPLRFDYRETHFRITDTGRTLRVDVGPGMGVEIRGRRYELEYFEFHRPSAARVGGQASDMAVHLHHRSADGKRAIVGVLLEGGEAPHPLIQTLWNNLPLERGSDYTPAVTIDPASLLPANAAHYLYMGSLETPPCTEGVLWAVMKQPLHLSGEQLAVFARLYARNGRPIQPANGRLILESR